jgi:hypothetical protein
MTRRSHLNTTSRIVPDWNWLAFEKKPNELAKCHFEFTHIYSAFLLLLLSHLKFIIKIPLKFNLLFIAFGDWTMPAYLIVQYFLS